MTFKVLLFATLKEKIGNSQISLELDEPAKVADLLNLIYQIYPQLVPYNKTILVAVNKNFASLDTIIMHADEIALFPPVSGG